MPERLELLSPLLVRALRCASYWHRGQLRKGSAIPYVEHVMGVALILDRSGFGENVVIAGLLHDAVEDTEATLAEIEGLFGSEVAGIVSDCSEQKTDSLGNKRPWIDRKRDHLAVLVEAGLASRAVILADKLNNLISIEMDLRDKKPIWSQFNADREQVLWYHRTMIDQLDGDEPRLGQLASEARRVLNAIEALEGGVDPLSAENPL